MCAVAALMIVRKVGTATLFIVAATLINTFVQGESLAIAVVGSFAGILADIYAYIMLRMDRNPYNNFRDVFIMGILMSVLWNIALWVVMVKFIYMLPMPNSVYYPVFILTIIGGIVGGVIGYFLGNKIKGLVG